MFIAVRTGTRGRFWVGQLVPGQGRAAGRFSCVRLVQLRSVAFGRVRSRPVAFSRFSYVRSRSVGLSRFGWGRARSAGFWAWMGGAEVSKRYFDVIFRNKK